jgi:hypothetical protein
LAIAVFDRYEFEFDQVFTPQATQEHVFREISQLVQSALDGLVFFLFILSVLMFYRYEVCCRKYR